MLSSSALPTARQEDLLLNSHLLAYESLVGTLTKQVLAQQEQLSELRSVISAANLSAVNASSGSLESARRETASADENDLVASPHPTSGARDASSSRGAALLEQLEPLIANVMSQQFYHAEERIAASLAERVRRITKEHVVRSVDREIRRLMRDAVVEACAEKTSSPPPLSTRRTVYQHSRSSNHIDTSEAPSCAMRSDHRLSNINDTHQRTARGIAQPFTSHRSAVVNHKDEVRLDDVSTRRSKHNKTTSLRRTDAERNTGPSDAEARLLEEMNALRVRLAELEKRSSRSVGKKGGRLPSSDTFSTSSSSSSLSRSPSNLDTSRSTRSERAAREQYLARAQIQTARSAKELLRHAPKNVDRDVDDLLRAFHDSARSH